MKTPLLLLALLLGCACQAQASPPMEDSAAEGLDHQSTAQVEAADYPWLAAMPAPLPPMTTLQSRFAPPKGFQRIEAGEMSPWLRGLPVRTDRRHVLSFRGDRLGSPSAAVVVLDVGEADLQQCADTAIRLRAEFLWQQGRASEVAYHFTSGDRSSWQGWRQGERFVIQGARVKKTRGKARANNHATFRGYLSHTFRYAGTRSLSRDSEPVGSWDKLLPGDFFVQGGSPGHAVVVLDVAQHPDGRRAVLVGQGFMPAQELHVVQRSGQGVLDGVWFVLPGDGEGELDTPSWRPFSLKDARRFH